MPGIRITIVPTNLPKITPAVWPEHRNVVEELFREYSSSIGVDICFQGFEQELANLPGKYAAPQGCVLLAFVDGKLAGCGALRPLDAATCEMKRLYVRSEFRGHHLGRALVESLVDVAKVVGYEKMRLDTLQTMQAAQTLYKSLGFQPIDPYYDNPLDAVVYLELKLAGN